jgi:phosphoribosylaminoimidazole-succinocarboxamide synthase
MRRHMASKKLLREDGIKKVYETNNEDQLLLEFTDVFVTVDGEKRGKIKGKSHYNTNLSARLYEYLESYHVMTHFISRDSDTELVVKRTELLPVDVVITNVASGSICRRLGLEEATEFEAPLIDYYYVNEKIKNPLINDSHLLALKLATAEEVRSIIRILPKINALLKSFFERRNLKLAELRCKFGKYKGHIVLAGDLTPEYLKLWDMDSHDKYDVERYASNLPRVEEIFQTIQNRSLGEVE